MSGSVPVKAIALRLFLFLWIQFTGTSGDQFSPSSVMMLPLSTYESVPEEIVVVVCGDDSVCAFVAAGCFVSVTACVVCVFEAVVCFDS